MARDFKVSMTLEAKDDASRQVARALKDTTGHAEKAAKALKQQGKAQQQAAASAAAAAKQQARDSLAASRAQLDEARRMQRAREALGIRSEQAIQREIDRTIASYNRLTRAGTLSAREQARAYRQMRQQVTELRREMKGVTGLQHANAFWSKGGAIAGAAAAAGAAFVSPIRNRMSYDERLTAMANDAFNDKSAQERQAGKQRLDKLIQKNVQTSGLNKEAVMAGADTLLKSGVKEDDVTNLLPMVTRYSVAANAAPQDIANVLTKMKDFGIKEDDLQTALNMVIASGQSGNFEVKDMARYLPSQMALGSKAGFYGLEGLKNILALNQVAVKTAGNNDEAGNNVNNLLAKLNANDTDNNAKTISLGGNKVLNYTDTLLQANAKGMNSLEATSIIIDRIMAKDKRYQQVQRELNQLDPKNESGRRELLASLQHMIGGSVAGKLFPDRQAMMAFLAYRYSGAYRESVEQDIEKQRHLKPGEQGAGDENFAFISQQDYFQLQKLNNSKDLAELNAAKHLTDAAGRTASPLVELAEQYPTLTAAVSGATTAIQGMTQAAIAFAGIKILTGGSAGAAAGAAAAGSAAGTAAKAGSAFGWISKALGPAMAVTAAATFTTAEEEDELLNGEAKWKALREKYPQEVIDKARKKYQPWYQFGRGYATENERWIKQYLETEGLGLPTPQHVMNAIQPVTPQSTTATTPPPQPTAPSSQVIRLEVDGQVLAETVNRFNAQEGVRG
ncbi:Phage-related minor tail protein [Shigella sonnei]|uniref:phage tail tape measure protein n=1 Tax=Shigella sonnei TaxID=624 RepID=UPI000972FC22|nr:phage tail tape measure protein [Shigella sonnei]SJI67546.1 Phage-related minor tail protein [Shigella sonnei]